MRFASLLLFITLIGSLFGQYTDEQINELIQNGSEKEILEQNTISIMDNNYFHARLLAEKLLEFQPENPNYNYRMGYALINSSSDFTYSKQYLEKAVKKISKNYDVFSTKENGSPFDALFHLGRSYHLNNEIDKAIEYYNLFLEKVPSKQSDLIDRAKVKLAQCEVAKGLLAKPSGNSRVVNLGATINSGAPDYSPVVSLDGYSLYFTSRRLRNDGSNKDIREPGTNDFLEDIYVSYKDDDGTWSEPELMDFCLPERNEATVAVSIDERRIYVYLDETGNGDIYYSDFSGSQFQELKFDNTKGLNTEFWEPHITVTPDGQQKYFSSDRPGGYGGRDIYRIVKLPDGTWSEPQNLGPTINTPYDEDAPFLAVDNKTMYFAHNGPRSMGGFDIFMSIRDDNDQWSEPLNLGAPINSTYDDLYYTTTIDGRIGYITSFRPGGQGEKDIYEVQNDISGVHNVAVLRGEIVTTDGQQIPEDIGFTVKCLDCEKSVDLTLFPRIKDGSFISPLEPCHEYEIIFHYDKGEKIFHREKFKTMCDVGYEEIYRHLKLDIPTMTIIEPEEEIDSFEPLAMKHYFGYNKNKLNPDQGALKEFILQIKQQHLDGRENIHLIINSSASKVPTRTFQSNERLAATRAEQLKSLLTEYFQKDAELAGKINIEIREVKVDGPEYTAKDFRNIEKYAPYQFVEVHLLGVNSLNTATILKSKDSELEGKTELPGTSVTSSVDKNGNEFKTGSHIQSAYKYHIIVGVFKRSGNADGMVADLKKKGFNAEMIGQRNGLYTVSAGTADNLSAAKQLLEKAREEVIPSAWILNTAK